LCDILEPTSCSRRARWSWWTTHGVDEWSCYY